MVKHNAQIGSQIAVELAKLKQIERTTRMPVHDAKEFRTRKRPVCWQELVINKLAFEGTNFLAKYSHISSFQVVIGGVNVDFTAAFKDEKVKVSLIGDWISAVSVMTAVSNNYY